MTGSAARDTVRVDKWLWAVRVFKTRTASNDACASGKVRVNNVQAKAATQLRPGDRVQVRVHGDTRQLEVVELLEKRVGSLIAAEAFIDHSPPPVTTSPTADPTFPFTAGDTSRRERGAGRPTKRDRRDIDRLRRG